MSTERPRRRRPRILVLWELGANYGHIVKMATIARPLSRAAEIVIAARDPVAMRQFAPDLDARLLAAPCAPPARPGLAGDRGRSYADMMRHCGWHDAETLAALLGSWRALFDLVAPDMIVGQAAPTGLLAARGGPWSTVLLGSGFDAPPRCAPMPPFRWWEPGAGASLAAREAQVVRSANAALDRLRLPRIEAFRDVLDTDIVLLAAFEALDQYRPRLRWEPDHPPYQGHLYAPSTGAALQWRERACRRILAYLRPGKAGFPQASAVLAAAPRDWDVILASPGIPRQLAARLAAAGVRVVDGPVRLDALLPRCDLGISHGSNGMAAAFLAAGVPQIALPSQLEQVMCARVLSDQTLGVGLIGGHSPGDLRAAIERALDDDDMRGLVRAKAAALGSSPVADGTRMALALERALAG